MRNPRSAAHGCVLAFFVVVGVALGEGRAQAQGRDALWNGTVIGAAVGAGLGVAFTHAVRDSDLGFDQYLRGALIFGAIGAGAGLGIDALLDRTRPGPAGSSRRLVIAPAVGFDFAGVAVRWKW